LTWKRLVSFLLTRQLKSVHALLAKLHQFSAVFGLVFRYKNFSLLTTTDVVAAIRQLPDKSSAADPIPTSVLKQTADLLAPCLT
jgi:hypothetical protein